MRTNTRKFRLALTSLTLVLALVMPFVIVTPVSAQPPTDVWVAPPPLGNDANPGTQAAPFATIQKGVDAVAEGGTVHVAAGTYTEQVLIQKSLDLIGAGEATTTIKAPATRSGSVTEGSNTWDYIVAAYAASGTIDVKIEGFTIDADGQAKTAGTAGLVGVFFRDVGGADAGLYSCTIHNFATTEYESWGIKVYGNSDLTIDDNTLTDYTRDGINVIGGASGNPNATISDNDLTGSATPLNGIYVSDGATGTISGNTVKDHTRSTPWAAVGIYVKDSDGITINGGNHIENCHYGMLLQRSDGSTVSGNTFKDNVAYHINLDDSDNNVVSGNTITGTAAGTEDKGIELSHGSTGNTIGGSTPAAGNTITLATSGTGLLYAIYLPGTVGAGNNTIQYNTILWK